MRIRWCWFLLCADQVGLVSAQIDENVYREIINHRSLRHPNIIQFIEVRARSRYFSIVYYSFLSFIIYSVSIVGVKKDLFYGLGAVYVLSCESKGAWIQGKFRRRGSFS